MNYKSIADRIGPRVGATQEWVFTVLRSGIIDGSLPGGTQLKQDEISAALNVSHIPVREALRRLESQNLVSIHPNRGATVSQLSRSALLDMMEVRATLSVMMLKNSAPLLTESDYAELRAVIDQQKTEKDLFRAEDLNYKFHDIMFSRADNSVADLFMELIHANIDRYLRAGFYSTEELRMTSVRQHEQIVDACERGEYELACDLLREHIIGAKVHIPKDML